MIKYFDTVVSRSTGLPVAGAVISVTTGAGGAVQLYSDDGVTPVTNPINAVRTNVAGLFEFYVDDGTYTLTYAYGDGTAVVISNVEIFDISNNRTTVFPALIGSTPSNPFQVNVGAFPTSAEIPGGIVQAFTSKVDIPASYTGQPWPVTAVSGYVRSANSAAGNSHVALFGAALSAAEGVNPYAINTVVTNGPQIINTPGANAGHDFAFAYGLELDFNIMKKAGGLSPTGTLVGLTILGGSETNTTGHNAAIEVFGLGTTSIPWSRGLHFRPGASSTAIQIDPTAWNGSGLYSQPIFFKSGAVTNGNTDSPPGGTLFTAYIRSTPSGSLELVGGDTNNSMGAGAVTLDKWGLQVVEVAVASVPTPAANIQYLFIDTADHKLKRKNSAGTVTIIA